MLPCDDVEVKKNRSTHFENSKRIQRITIFKVLSNYKADEDYHDSSHMFLAIAVARGAKISSSRGWLELGRNAYRCQNSEWKLKI